MRDTHSKPKYISFVSIKLFNLKSKNINICKELSKMSAAKSEVVSKAGETTSKQSGSFIKRNPWVLLVGVFAVLIVAGIVFS